MYIVRMKRVTASDARKNWFRLLDEVVAGETVVIERRGRRVLLSCEQEEQHAAAALPDYRSLIDVPEIDRADGWSWRWTEEGVEIEDGRGDR